MNGVYWQVPPLALNCNISRVAEHINFLSMDLNSDHLYVRHGTCSVAVWLLGFTWLSACAPELQIEFALNRRLEWPCEFTERFELDCGHSVWGSGHYWKLKVQCMLHGQKLSPLFFVISLFTSCVPIIIHCDRPGFFSLSLLPASTQLVMLMSVSLSVAAEIYFHSIFSSACISYFCYYLSNKKQFQKIIDHCYYTCCLSETCKIMRALLSEPY